MAALPIEVSAKPGQRLGMSPAAFLRHYWQKRPLLIRGAFADFDAPLTPEELAGLACEDNVLARLIRHEPRHDRWSVRSGPFRESDFTRLPRSHWTVLVQDVEKWHAPFEALVDAFDFLPRWRVDDVMVSYAADRGGVGPHVDQYDVFLVQGPGTRRWRISDDADAPREFREDVELKLLKQFDPTHDWLLEPGDTLYLPPNVPHDGVAEGPCLTFSVGMRAPSAAELILDLAEAVAEPLGEDLRYTDPDLRPTRDAHEIDAAAMARVETALAALRGLDESALRQWFGRYITRYRAAQRAVPPPPLTPAKLMAALERGDAFWRHPFSRFAWTREARGAVLYAAGAAYACSAAFARRVCAQRRVVFDAVPGGADRAALQALVDDGHLVIQRARKGTSQ